jgi:hypothetical protein
MKDILIKIILTLFMYLAALGLLFSLILHISDLLGIIQPAFSSQAAQVATYLILFMIVVWGVAIFAPYLISKYYMLGEFWSEALRGCPKWLKYLPYLLFAYFILFADIHRESGIQSSPSKVKEFSALGFCMAVYAGSLALLYSALRFQDVIKARKCPNGHQVPWPDKLCEECGAQVLEFAEPDKQKDARSV